MVALLAAALALAPFAAQLYQGDTVPPVALVDQDGRAFDVARFRGRSVVMSFVYTRCTDRCALVAAKLAQLARMTDSSETAVIALTVDPAYDRPPELRRYRTLFGPAPWTLATGNRAELTLLERRLGVAPRLVGVQRVDHNDLVVLLDRAGRIWRFIPGDDWTPQELASLARSAAGEREGPLPELALFFQDATARCGLGIASLGIGTALVLACLLALPIAVLFVRSVLRFQSS